VTGEWNIPSTTPLMSMTHFHIFMETNKDKKSSSLAVDMPKTCSKVHASPRQVHTCKIEEKIAPSKNQT